MPHLTPTLPHCTAPFAVLAAVAFAVPAAATVPTTYLPDNSMLVVSLNVKQLLRAPLVHADEKAFKEAMESGTKALETFGVNPAKDVDRMIVAVGEDLKAATSILLLHGRFDATKIDGRLRQLARERKNDVQVIEEGGATMFQGRLP